MHIEFIQKIIDKIRHKVPLNSYIMELGTKILTYKKFSKNIDTIILGSSHAQLGYRAEYNEFNLGLSFQDLYCSYNLYKKLNNKNIKNVILFYSVFSPGAQTIKSKFADTMTVYKVIAGFDYQDINIAKEKKINDLEQGYKHQFNKLKKTFIFNSDYRGNEVSYITCFKPPIAADRAKPHFKNNQRHNNQTKYIEYLQSETAKNNQNLYIVIPPATEDYKKALPQSKELYKELFNVKGLNIFNYYDEHFANEEFEDWDHLNLKGAVRLTKMIRDNISEKQLCVKSNTSI